MTSLADPAPATAPAHDAGHTALYQWLSGLFAREPAAGTLAAWQRRDARDFLLDRAEAAGLADETAALLALVEARPDTEAFAFELAGTYARLFLGAGGRSAVPPYASVYTSPQGRLFQQATTAMEVLLAESGLAVAGGTEPADHVAVALEFLAELSAAAAGGDPAAAARRRRLVSEHLLKWVPTFCALCIERDPSGFYAAAARVLDGLMRQEAARLSAD